jgi:hypothetical protein
VRGDISFHLVHVMRIDLDLLAFILYFVNQFWIASRLVCSVYDAMAGSLSMASTAVTLTNVSGDSGEVGRSAVQSRYNNSPRALPCGMPALTWESSVYLFSSFTRKCLLCK